MDARLKQKRVTFRMSDNSQFLFFSLVLLIQGEWNYCLCSFYRCDMTFFELFLLQGGRIERLEVENLEVTGEKT